MLCRAGNGIDYAVRRVSGTSRRALAPVRCWALRRRTPRTPDAPGRLCAAGGGALGLRCSRPLRSAPCALCAAFSWRPVGRLSALAAAVPRAPCRRRASPSPSGVVARAGALVGVPAASVSAHNFIPPPRSLRSRRPLPVPGRGLCASRPRLRRRTLARAGLASACRRALAGCVRWKSLIAALP